MLTAYRRRFIAITMALIAMVLLLALVMQGIFVYRNEYQDMRRTMGMVLEPWRMMGDGFRPENPGPLQRPEDDGFEPDEGFEHSNAPPMDRDRIRDERIATVFYEPEDNTYTIMPNGQGDDNAELLAAAKAAVDAGENFGLVEGFYYMKEGNDGLKIALTRTEYLRSRVFSNLSVLMIAYPLAMGLLFFISLWLSKLAAQPMEQAMEMERQFVADISHDLKTPITVVLANDAILRSNPGLTAGEQMQWIDSTDDAAHNMMDMVEQMLTLSSLESVSQPIEKTEVNLSACAEKSVLQLESVAYEREIAVESDIAPDVRTSATEDYCMRIVSGLIENALKYEPDGGTVHVSLTRERKRALLTVHNAGSTISQEDLPRVFERFYRGDKARSDSRGHGLGLPIVKGICDLLDAEIQVRSAEQSGTVFTVLFQTL